MVDLKELNELYNVLDLYVVSSRIEGGPQAIMECAITETPIVSTDVGIASEILNQESIYKSIEQFHKAQPNTEFALQKAKSFIIPKEWKVTSRCLRKFAKVSIGSKIVEGPWGGGNLFVKNMTEFLIDNGHQVIYDLPEPDIDLILLTDPRSRKESSSTFNHVEILKYKKYVNNNVVVVQRINECDERKGTDTINNFYLEASNCADHIIFVSSWLREIYLNLEMDKDKTSVILAGANSEIFNPSNASFLGLDRKN